MTRGWTLQYPSLHYFRNTQRQAKSIKHTVTSVQKTETTTTEMRRVVGNLHDSDQLGDS